MLTLTLRNTENDDTVVTLWNRGKKVESFTSPDLNAALAMAADYAREKNETIVNFPGVKSVSGNLIF
jgi:hypothetical protein